MTRNWVNQNTNLALKTKTENSRVNKKNQNLKRKLCQPNEEHPTPNPQNMVKNKGGHAATQPELKQARANRERNVTEILTQKNRQQRTTTELLPWSSQQ